MENIKKSYEITDAKISFVSLVDKAANQKQFLLVKSDSSDERGFATLGKIVKSDADTHHVTGVVYEPMVNDAHDNYMSEDEIVKAAYWYAKNGDKVDLQHDFQACSSCTVVETWVAKADFDFGSESIKKGTWLMTVEISDDEIWDQIEKGEITGFSMGGVGKYSTEDVEIDAVEKGGDVKVDEKKGIFKQLAEAFGLAVVEKGAMTDVFEERQKSSGFWNATQTLEELLCRGHWDYSIDRYVYDFESDETTVREALEEFSAIIADLLTAPNITKALLDAAPESLITKAGKKMSSKNKAKLTEIMDLLKAFADEFDDEKEEDPVKKDEAKQFIEETVAKALAPESAPAAPEDDVTSDDIQKMVAEAVAKAMKPDEHVEAPVEKATDVDADNLKAMVNGAVTKALEPLLKAHGLPSNLNDDGEHVEKSTHYLHGIL